MATETKHIDANTTEITVSHTQGLRYTFRVHSARDGQPPGISLTRSPVLPIGDIPFLVQALQTVYTSVLEAGKAIQAKRGETTG